jgi:hypothetical protein
MFLLHHPFSATTNSSSRTKLNYSGKTSNCHALAVCAVMLERASRMSTFLFNVTNQTLQFVLHWDKNSLHFLLISLWALICGCEDIRGSKYSMRATGRFRIRLCYWMTTRQQTLVPAINGSEFTDEENRKFWAHKTGYACPNSGVPRWDGVGVEGFKPPPRPKFQSFDKAEPNSQFRGIYIYNDVIRIRVSFICKLSGTAD